MAKLNVKKGDNVVVLAGKDNGKTGKILVSYPKKNRVLVEGVNIITKAQKPKSAQEKGGIIKVEAPIDASNVMVICPECGKATRVAHKVVDGKKVRVCKKCGEILDAKVKKTAAKKTTKKATASKEKSKDVKTKAPSAKTEDAKNEE